MNALLKASHCFGDVVVDRARREIRKAGRAEDTQPKVFDLLCYLIEHRDRVVDKDELMEHLWPGLVVTESSLTQALRKARRIVGDDGDRQEVIRTIQRRGFRFVAPLATADMPGTAPQAATDAAAGGQDADDERSPASVAVLPFIDLSPGADQGHLCAGMAEEILNALTRLRHLRVAARSSAFASHAARLDVREIGQRLRVVSVVEGSVRRDGDRLRVSVQLADTATGFSRWTHRWEGPLTSVFAIQDEIATRVAEALQPSICREERSVLHSRPRTVPEAYDYYLRGLQARGRFGRRAQAEALAMFGRALELDPDYAPAWAGKATSHVFLYQYADASDEHRRLANDAGQRAVQLDPRSAEAQVALGAAAAMLGDDDASDRAFREAQQINPQLFEAWCYHARACSARGQHVLAAQLYEAAARVRPEDVEALTLAAQSYASLGQHELRMNAAARAAAAARRAIALEPGNVRVLTLGAGPLFLVGERELAAAWIARACELAPEEPSVQYNSACAFVMMGDYDRALDYLERVGVEAMANRSWMLHDAELDPLRAMDRFRRLLARAR